MPVFLEVAEGLAADEGRMSGAHVTGPFTLLAQLLGTEELLDRVRLGDSLTEPMAFATSVVGEYAAALAARVDMIVLVDPAAEALRAEEYGSLCRPYVTGLAGIIRASALKNKPLYAAFSVGLQTAYSKVRFHQFHSRCPAHPPPGAARRGARVR
jgi:uroporphyrinogen-III decarboxylase